MVARKCSSTHLVPDLPSRKISVKLQLKKKKKKVQMGGASSVGDLLKMHKLVEKILLPLFFVPHSSHTVGVSQVHLPYQITLHERKCYDLKGNLLQIHMQKELCPCLSIAYFYCVSLVNPE